MLQSTSTPWAHQGLELLAYFAAARVYWPRARRAPRPDQAIDRWLILASAVFGAMLGSKALHMLQHLDALRAQPWPVWWGGKTLLGGFLGGTIGVEIAKRAVGWTRSTGDAWLPAIVVGVVVGRAGCQLSGLWDQTYGNPTELPWAWDYGDGVPRHPVALYEIVWVSLAYAGLAQVQGKAGWRFAAWMFAYCVGRLLLDFLKPPFAPAASGTLATSLYAGLSAIQWAAVAGLLYFGRRALLLRDPPQAKER